MSDKFGNLKFAFFEMYNFISDLPSGFEGFVSDFDAAAKELERAEEIGRSTMTKCISEITDRLPDRIWKDAQKEVLNSGNQGYWSMVLVAIEKLSEFWIDENSPDYYERKIFELINNHIDQMRDATPEEQKIPRQYWKEHSSPLGHNVWEENENVE